MKQALKISPSTLEDYRNCTLGNFRKTTEDFILKLDQPWIKTEPQSKGEAYHKLIELGPLPFQETTASGATQYRVNDPEMNIDWIFNEAQAAPALATHVNHPNVQREVWGRLNFDTDKYSIRVNLRVDALDQHIIWDYKTTGSKYTPREQSYFDSVQWPLYMMAYPDAKTFQFRVFHLHDLTCKQYDFVFQKDLEREKNAMYWMTNLIDFAEKRGIIQKFYHLTDSNNESVRNRNAIPGDGGRVD